MTISEVFTNQQTSSTLILCMVGNKVMGYRPDAQAWISTPDLDAPDQELFAAIDQTGFYVAAFPQKKEGRTYQLFVNAQSPGAGSAVLTKLLTETVAAHKPDFSVPPDPETIALLEKVTGDKATLVVQIEFRERRYTLLTCLRCGAVQFNQFTVDPTAFESALRVKGWRQTDPPIHQNGSRYHVLIERAEGERYLLTDKTDLQKHKQRETGLTAHFMLNYA